MALSTAEAEYMALASATQQLLSDLKSKPTGPMLILEDNQATICMAKNSQYHGRAKHIDIKYHFIRENVASAAVKLEGANSYFGGQDRIFKKVLLFAHAVVTGLLSPPQEIRPPLKRGRYS